MVVLTIMIASLSKRNIRVINFRSIAYCDISRIQRQFCFLKNRVMQNQRVKADERYESSIIIVIRVRRGNYHKALANRCAISTSNPAMTLILPQYEN